MKKKEKKRSVGVKKMKVVEENFSTRIEENRELLRALDCKRDPLARSVIEATALNVSRVTEAFLSSFPIEPDQRS